MDFWVKAGSRFFLILLLVLALPVTAGAAVKKNTWVEKHGKWYYYDAKGKRATGLKTIGKKQYYFDRNGVQRTGWRKIGKSYYRFRMNRGNKGYMFKSATYEKIRLGKDGKAILNTSRKKKKVKLMVRYALWADEVVDWTMSRREKMAAAYAAYHRYSYRNEPDFSFSKKNWDIDCAKDVIDRKDFAFPTAECYRFSASFGYMLNAIFGGSKVTICSNGGHGWTVYNGTIYDLTKAINRQDMGYFPVSEGRLGEYHAVYTRELD